MSLRSLFVIVVILIPGTFLAFTSRLRALLMYLWYAFFRPQDWIYVDIRFLRLSFVYGLILLVPALLTGVFPNVSHPLSVGSLAFLGAAFVAQIGAVNQATGWIWMDFLGRLLLVCLLAVTVIRTPRDYMRVVAVVAGSLGFFGTKAGIVSLIGSGIQFNDGLAGAFADNNGYAMAVVMTMPLLLGLAQNAELTFAGLVPSWMIRWIRYGLYLSIPCCAYTVVCTFSRAGVVAMAAITLTFFLFHPRRFRLILGFGLLALLVVTFVPLPAGYLERVQTIALPTPNSKSAAADDPTEGRLHFWHVAIDMADARPFGVGLRNFEYTYDRFDTLQGAYGVRRSVHSSHFQVLAELGYDGLAIWLFLFGYGFLVAFRVRRRSKSAGLDPKMSRFLQTMSMAFVVSMVGFLVGGAFIALALNDLTWLTFSLLASLDILSKRLLADAAAAPVGPPAPQATAVVGAGRRPLVASGETRYGQYQG